MSNRDLRNTQEIFGDLFGGLASLGARGVDGLIMAAALARLMIEKGLITQDEFIKTMYVVAEEELNRDKNTTFLIETLQDVLKRLENR
jgi:hypothetical protein